MELFWVFLGLLLGGVFLGVVVNSFRKRRADNTPTKTEEEIEAYEETLKHKLEEETKEEDDKKES